MCLLFSLVCLSWLMLLIFLLFVFFFKAKTAYVMPISDWNSDVFSSGFDELGACFFDNRLNPGFLLRLRIFRDRKIMIGDVLEPGLDGERLLGMVRDDRDDVHVDLADAACIEQMAKAEIGRAHV